MAHRCLGDSIGRVATFERAHDTPAAPRVRACDDRPREVVEIVELQREIAEGVAGKRVEPGRDEDDIRDEAPGGSVDRVLESSHVLTSGQTSVFRDVPDSAMRSAIFGGTGSGVPRPLVHGNEVNVRLIRYQ